MNTAVRDPLHRIFAHFEGEQFVDCDPERALQTLLTKIADRMLEHQPLLHVTVNLAVATLIVEDRHSSNRSSAVEP